MNGRVVFVLVVMWCGIGRIVLRSFVVVLVVLWCWSCCIDSRVVVSVVLRRVPGRYVDGAGRVVLRCLYGGAGRVGLVVSCVILVVLRSRVAILS